MDEGGGGGGDVVANDARAARRLNLPGTPSFFLNNEQIESPQGDDAFRELLVSRVGEPVVVDESTASTTEDVE